MGRIGAGIVVVGSVVALLGAAVRVNYGQRPRVAACPAIADGFKVVRVGGAQATAARWLSEGPAVQRRKDTAAALVALEAALGSVEGFEVAATVPISGSFRRTYVVVLHEQAPSFAWFDCYRTRRDWIVTNVRLSAEPEAIVPARAWWTGGVRE